MNEYRMWLTVCLFVCLIDWVSKERGIIIKFIIEIGGSLCGVVTGGKKKNITEREKRKIQNTTPW